MEVQDKQYRHDFIISNVGFMCAPKAYCLITVMNDIKIKTMKVFFN